MERVNKQSEIAVKLPVTVEEDGRVSVANEAVTKVAGDVVLATHAANFVKGDKEEVKFIHLNKGRNAFLKFTLRGFKPMTGREALALVVQTWPVAWEQAMDPRPEVYLSSEWVNSRRMLTWVEKEGDYIKARLDAKIYDFDVAWLAKRLVAHTNARNYRRLATQSRSRHRLRDNQLELVLKGYQPKTVREAEQIIRYAINGK